MRVVGGLLAVLLVLSGCAAHGDEEPGAWSSPAATLAAIVRAADHGCTGIRYRDVRGTAPSYGLRRLRTYPGLRHACRGYWLPHDEHGFVPQGLALDGRTAWVSGYTWHTDVADNACRLMHLDLRTGRLLADQGRLVGAPGDRRPTFCRHGGGLALDRHGLWIAERDRLWLVDPDKVGGKDAGHAVIRVWRLRAPVYGSTMMIRAGRLVLARYRSAPRSSLSRFRIKDVLRPGVLELVGRARQSFELGRASHQRMAGHAQGITWRHGPVVTVSRAGCGDVVLPGGRRIGLIPRIEDIEFTGRNHVWVLSESSAQAFQHPDRPVVPMLSKYVTSKVLALHGPGDCFGRQ